MFYFKKVFMKSLILSITAMFILSGCIWQTVSHYDIEKAVHECKGLENVVQITAAFVGDEVVTCKSFVNK